MASEAAKLQAGFSELQGLLEASNEAHRMYARLSDLSEADPIYVELLRSHQDANTRKRDGLVRRDVQRLIGEWSREVDEVDERIDELRELLEDGGYDINSWIVEKFTISKVAEAEADPEAKRMRAEVDAKLAVERPVERCVGNETRVFEIGASGYMHEEYDEHDVDAASVDELEELKPEEEAAVVNENAPDKLCVFTEENDAREIEDPVQVFDSGAVWEYGFRVSPNLAETLQDYQLECVSRVVERVCDNKGFLVAHGMGLGKTLTTLAALSTLATRGKLHAIVACPSSMIFPWCNEVSKWTTKGVVDIDAYPVEKSDIFARNHALWLRTGGILVLSHEMLKRSLQQLKQDFCVTSNMVLVFDEAHLLKSPNTQLYQAVDGMPTDRRILLTGTPLQNHLKEYFAMVHLMSPGLLGTKIADFNKVYGADIERGMLKESTDEEIAKSKRAVVRLKKTVEEVMHSVPSAVLKDMLPKKIEFRLLHDVTTELADVDSGAGVITERHNVHAAALLDKVTLTVELIDEILGATRDRIVVFSPYLDILTMCAQARDGFVLTGDASAKERDEIIAKFRSQDASILYASTGAGGVGVDFSVANRVIVTDASWNPAVDMQAIARLWRMGQKNVTYVYRLIGSATLEERILRMQVQKTSLAMRVMEEQEITRFYSRQDLSELTVGIENERMLVPDDVADIDPCLAAVQNSSTVGLTVSSHDEMFLDEDVELSSEEISRAMNEMTETMFDETVIRTFTMRDGTVQSVNGTQTLFRAPYASEIVPPYKPLSVRLDATDAELEHFGKFKVKFVPEVSFSKAVPLWMCFGPSFPPEAGDPYELEVVFQTRRRWEPCGRFSAHVDPKIRRLYYKIAVAAGSHKFKVRFVGPNRMSDWSEESELVTVTTAE